MNSDKLRKLISELKNAPSASFGKPNKNSIQNFEENHGVSLPDDIKEFYSQLDELSIYDKDYHFIKLESVKQAGLAVYNDFNSLPESWFAFCYIGESWLGFDCANKVSPIIDLDPYATDYDVISFSLLDFLERLVSAEEKSLFWQSIRGYCDGKALIKEGSLVLKQRYADFWDKLESDKSGGCIIESCTSLKVLQGIHCKRHHYENVIGGECPFETDIEWSTSYKYAVINRG